MLVSMFGTWSLVSAQTVPPDPSGGKGLVTCGNNVVDGKVIDACNFNYAMEMVRLIMRYAFWLTMIIVTAVIVYAGFKYMLSRGNPSEVTKANKMFTTIIKGLLFMFCAWLIVFTIENTLLRPDGEAKTTVDKYFLNPFK